MMSFDNGATNRKPDSHSIVLCCEESLKELVRGLSWETHSCILHAKAHLIPLAQFGSDEQFPWAIVIEEGSDGLILGLMYLASRRNLAIPIVADGVCDTIDIALLFLGKYPGL
jgi:hypothetical protein